MLSFKFRTLAIVCYLSLAAPILVFFLGWLRWYISIPAALVLSGGLLWLVKKDYWNRTETISLPLKHIAPIIAFALLWVLISGCTGVCETGVDIPWRTAVFRDLVTYDWPVIYPETGSGLCYYVTLWLPIALIGKVVGFEAALVLLWLFLSFYVVLAYLLIVSVLKISRPSHLWIAALILAFWSGLVCFGNLVLNLAGATHTVLFSDATLFLKELTEPQDIYLIFRGNYGVLINVYNQVPIWVCVGLMLDAKTPRGFLCVGMMLYCFSPWGVIGIAPLMIAKAIPWLLQSVREHRVATLLLDVASPANLSALIACGITMTAYLFFSGTSGSDPSGSGGIQLINFANITPTVFAAFIVFYVVQFGIYAALIARRYARSALFWGTIATLVLVPLVRIGSAGWDFIMNASLPAFFTLMVFVIGALLSCPFSGQFDYHSLRDSQDDATVKVKVLSRTCKVLLAIALVVGAISPAISYFLSVGHAISHGEVVSPERDSIYTLANRTKAEETSLAEHADERESLFYKYFAR